MLDSGGQGGINMKTAIMQPYLFPYIGYWQLINAVDSFVILDDVNYIKRGYINRNSILINGQPYRFSVPVKDASQNRLIKDMELYFGEKEKVKFLVRIENAYRKAPFFDMVMPLVRTIVENDTDDLTGYVGYSIEKIMDYLKMRTKIMKSSDIQKDNTLAGQDRIIEICEQLHTDIYVNPSGGRLLYQAEKFKAHGIALYFLDTKFDKIVYRQFGHEFVENLSIIDVLMFNSVDRIQEFLEECMLNG